MPGGWQDSLPWIISAAGAMGGGLSNRAISGTGSSRNTTMSSVSPSFDPKDLDFFNSIRDKYSNLLTTDPDLKGYQAEQIGGFNRSSDIQKRLAEETLGARGITGGPALATSLNSVDAQRFSNITKLNQSLPLLSRQMQESTLEKALAAFGMAPHSVNTVSTGTTDTTTKQDGNVAGGTIGSLASMLAFFLGGGKLDPSNHHQDADLQGILDFIANTQNSQGQNINEPLDFEDMMRRIESLARARQIPV